MRITWQEQSAADVPTGNDWLSPAEFACLAAMRFAQRRDDWRLGRWTAKCAVSSYLGLPVNPESFQALEIRASPSGAPMVLSRNKPAAVTVSLSHRAGMAVCAVAPCSAMLGCDIELVEPRSDAFLADYFTGEEQALVADASPRARSLLLTLLWSGKESVLKALGVGLRVDTRSVSVAPEESFAAFRTDWLPLVTRYAEREIFRGWWYESAAFVRTVVAAPTPLAPDSCALTRACSGDVFREGDPAGARAP